MGKGKLTEHAQNLQGFCSRENQLLQMLQQNEKSAQKMCLYIYLSKYKEVINVKFMDCKHFKYLIIKLFFVFVQFIEYIYINEVTYSKDNINTFRIRYISKFF